MSQVERERIIVALGNRHAVDDGQKMPKGKRSTDVYGFVDEGATIGSIFTDIIHPQGIWATHATDGAAPAWVASNRPALAQLLADHFGGIEVRDLQDRRY